MALEGFIPPEISPEWHDNATVTLGELIEGGWFDWSNPIFDWSEFAHDAAQYQRVCAAFEARYYYREISMVPPKKWAMRLMYRIRYEICPTCNALYDALDGVNVLADSDKYGKRRDIRSDYPETQLSGNSDFLSSGVDAQYEDIALGKISDTVPDIAERWRGVDQIFLDKCAIMFSDLVAGIVNDY